MTIQEIQKEIENRLYELTFIECPRNGKVTEENEDKWRNEIFDLTEMKYVTKLRETREYERNRKTTNN